MIKPFDYQEDLADQVLEVLRDFGLAYLAAEERTGKSLSAIRVAEKSLAKSVLVITKRKAYKDWDKLINKGYKPSVKAEVETYHKVTKEQIQKADLIVLDESHNYISAFPKPGQVWKKLKPLLKGKPILYLSATPHAQGVQMLYHQFALSSWSPWNKYTNFYSWFNRFGKPYTITINGFDVKQYDRVNTEEVLQMCEHLFVTKTREELGFDREPEDVIHNVNLSESTKTLYNTLVEDEIITLDNGKTLVCDTQSKLRFTLHMLEGGTAKIDDDYIVLDNTEKVDKIKDLFGDCSNTVIMYNYKAEKLKLEKHFKNSLLLQATSYAEGVDLHEYDNLVIYSQDFSTARHTQRRARQCNKNRTKPIKVHYLLTPGAISSQVYKTVSLNKKNFVNSVFKRNKL